MKDYLVRGMTMDGFVKVVAIRSTEMVRRGAEIHKTTLMQQQLLVVY